jgi:hypothetical protein
MTSRATMKPHKYLAAFGILVAMAGCIPGNGDFTSDGMDPYSRSNRISRETHGTPLEMAPFSSRDIPQHLPVRTGMFDGSGLALIVKHSQGYSTVEPLYELNEYQRYSSNGTGQPAPVEVRINPPENPNSSYVVARSKFRRLETDKEYQFHGPFLSKWNRNAAIGLAQEVLAKTHCAGGSVTLDTDRPEVAQSYGRNNRTASGLKMMPGWVVHLRCSRWREK